jgi:transposase InsO family protein
MGNTFGPKGFQRLQSPYLQIQVTEVVIHKADEPNAVLDFLDADSLTRPALSDSLQPNDLWCTDYKGSFSSATNAIVIRSSSPIMLRAICSCEALESNRGELALRPLTGWFGSAGLAQAIRSDNGVPFALPHSVFQLSKLSVWWLRLGITIERIRPGHPQHNGLHEGMHLILKRGGAPRPADARILQQQAKFDSFIEEFNNERPHKALAMQ